MNIVTPEAITTMTTFKCTAECEECCYQCSRNRNERLDIMTIKSYIKESREVFHNLKAVYFTGGECFLLGNDLIEAISYATSLKLLTRCVTNGYWGKNSKKAFDLAAKLKKAGLKEINFSTGDNHQKFVPIDSVIEAAIACATNGIRTLIIVEGSKNYAYKLEELNSHYSGIGAAPQNVKRRIRRSGFFFFLCKLVPTCKSCWKTAPLKSSISNRQ